MNVAGGELNWIGTLNDSQFQAGINRMERSVNRTSSSIQTQGSQIEGWAKSAAAAAAGFFSVQAAGGFISSLIQVRSQFQQLDVAFSTMLKSQVASKDLMKELVGFAAETPFGLKDAAGAAKQLLAYGSTAKGVVDELRMLGDVASGVSVPIGDLVYLYGTLKTQGRAYAVDIRQFAGRGIPIYAELAKVLGVAKDKVADLVSAGKVGFTEVEQAFKNMTASGGMFGGLMEKQSKTWAGQIERFKDAWDLMLNEIGKSQEGVFATGIAGLTSMVESYQSIIDIITISVAAYGIYRTALFATAAFEKVSTASKFGLAIAVNQESVARIANANALVVELQAEVSSLAIKKAAATQAAVNAAASLEEAQANLANASSAALVAARNKAALAGKAAMAASSAFFTAKLNLETASQNGATTAQLAKMRAEVSSLATKKASTLQTYISTTANVKNIESKVTQAATERVVAAQEKAAIARKAALSASSEFHTAKTNLETTAKVANSAATVELTAVESINAAGKRILTQVTAAYNAVLAASPVLAFTAVIAALGIAIYSLTQVTDAAEEAQRKLNEAKEEGGKEADIQKRKAEQLIAVLKDESATIEQKKTAYDKLQESTDGVLKAYSAEQIASGQAIKGLEDYIVKIREAAAARKAFAEYNELGDKLDELNRKGMSAVGNWTRAGRSLKNTFIPTSQGLSWSEWVDGLVDGKVASKKIMDQEKEVLTTSMEELKKEFGGKFSEIITGTKSTVTTPVNSNIKNKPFYENIVKQNTEALEALDKGSKDFEAKAAPLKKKIQDAQRELLSFSVTKPGRLDNDEKAALKRKEDMMEKIFDLNEKYNTKALTDDQQKLQEIRNEFIALQKDIEAYNADPKNKKINPNLKPALEKALENKQYEIDTEKLSLQLDKQKTLYDEYEDYKSKTGKVAADKRYKNEIDTNITLLQKLEADRALLLTKDPLDMTALEADRLKVLDKQINQEVAAQKQKYDELVKGLISYEKQRKLLTETYNIELAQARERGSLEEQSILTKNYKKTLGELDDSHIKELDSYKKLYEGIDRLSDANARKVIANARALLAQQLASGKITAELAKQIGDSIDQAEAEVGGKSADRLINVANQIDQITTAIGGMDSAFGKVLSTVSNVVGQVGNIKKGMEAFNKKGATPLDKLGAGLGILGAGISIISTIAGLFDNTAKRQEQEAYARDLQIKQTEAVTKALDRQLQLINEVYGTEKLIKYAEGLETIKIKQQDLTKQLSGKFVFTGNKDFDKFISQINNGEKVSGDIIQLTKFIKLLKSDSLAKLPTGLDELRDLLENGKLDEKTAALVQGLLTLDKQAKDTFNALNAEKVGSSLDSIADGFISALTDGTQDFGKSFEEVIQKSIINGFKGELIRKQLQAFYAQFAELADGGLTKDEIEKLKLTYMAAGEKAKKELEDLEKVTGISITDKEKEKEKETSPNSAVGAIRRDMTEETAGILTGLWRGTYDLTKQSVVLSTERNEILRPMGKTALELLNMAKANYDIALKTEANTRRTADNTDRLKGIELGINTIASNTKPTTTARGLGI